MNRRIPAAAKTIAAEIRQSLFILECPGFLPGILSTARQYFGHAWGLLLIP
jgi:hypothetical protein